MGRSCDSRTADRQHPIGRLPQDERPRAQDVELTCAAVGAHRAPVRRSVEVIVTERLVLHTLPPALVELLARRDWEAARATQPLYDISEETFSADEHVLLLRHAQLTSDPDEEPWLMRVAVLEGTRQVIGRVGFHQPPDAEGVVEIGYSVTPRFRRQGASRSRWQPA
jgi:RimJ/RimL family protein N-acetyltransferase